MIKNREKEGCKERETDFNEKKNCKDQNKPFNSILTITQILM